jgi:hypothetical protein
MGMAASIPRGAGGAAAASASGVCAASASPAAGVAGAAAAFSSAASAAAPLPPTAVLRDRAAGAIWAALAADALAMPVHWYYNPADIQRAFPGGVGGRFPYGEDGDGDGGDNENGNGGGGASYFSAPPKIHPSSIMTLHSTSGQGRGSQGGGKSVIGDVINHGKKQYWGKSGTHYHNW